MWCVVGSFVVVLVLVRQPRLCLVRRFVLGAALCAWCGSLLRFASVFQPRFALVVALCTCFSTALLRLLVLVDRALRFVVAIQGWTVPFLLVSSPSPCALDDFVCSAVVMVNLLGV